MCLLYYKYQYNDVLIDWEKVSQDYDGIEICPYLLGKRMTIDWYYSWDVSSGCIWRSSGIEELVLLSELIPVSMSTLKKLDKILPIMQGMGKESYQIW